MYRVRRNCSAQETLPIIDCHSSNWIIEQEATVDNKGIQYRECIFCDKILEKEFFYKTIYITLWISNAEDFTEEKIEEFKALYPECILNISVYSVSEEDAAGEVVKDLFTAPDIYCFTQDQIYRLIQANGLAELDSDSAQKVKSENDELTVEAVTVEDGVYAYPLTHDNGYFLYYDASIVSDEEAQTLEGIIAACERENKLIGYNLSNAWIMSSFFFAQNVENNIPLCTSKWTYSGNSKYPASVTDTFNSDGGLIAMKAMQKLTSSQAWLDNSDMFANTGAMVSGLWNLNFAMDAYGENMRVAKLPTFTVDGETYQLGSFSGYRYLGCKPQTDPEKSKICNALALYLTSEEVQLDRYLEFQWGPSNKNVQNHESVKSFAPLSALWEQNKYSQILSIVPDEWWNEAPLLAVAAKNAESEDDLRAALQKYEEEINKYITN